MCTSRSSASTCWFWPAYCSRFGIESITDDFLSGTRVSKIQDQLSTELIILLSAPVEPVFCGYYASLALSDSQKPDFPDENQLVPYARGLAVPGRVYRYGDLPSDHSMGCISGRTARMVSRGLHAEPGRSRAPTSGPPIEGSLRMTRVTQPSPAQSKWTFSARSMANMLSHLTLN